MVGNEYMYMAKNHNVLSYQIDKEIVTIVTDVKWYKFPKFKVLSELRDFLPVENNGKQLSVITPQIDGSVFSQLKKDLLDSIKKVKENAEYIPQASAINKNVKTLIDMAKTEIEMVKVMKQQ